MIELRILRLEMSLHYPEDREVVKRVLTRENPSAGRRSDDGRRLGTQKWPRRGEPGGDDRDEDADFLPEPPNRPALPTA